MSVEIILTHGVIGNTSDFGSAESWFEPRWVNKKSESGSVNKSLTLFVLPLALTLTLHKIVRNSLLSYHANTKWNND